MVKVDAQGVDKKTTANFNKQLVVPLILTSTNTMNCKVFHITYEIKVTCKTQGCSMSPKIKFPITLGSVPLSFDQAFQPNMTMTSMSNASIYMRKSFELKNKSRFLLCNIFLAPPSYVE